jgi:hypothetical protein
MDCDRADVVRTIREYRETVLEVCTADPALALRLFDDDPLLLDALLDLACLSTGVPRVLYDAVLAADAELFELQRLALEEIVAEPPDPGPYAQISRESPAGTPENYHVHDWNGITPIGGVGGS